ncbi:hypothetical protein FCIRC_6535 [Fusarium circinatum]|uniref:Zn(2)-C6 fungal-type domain-containing protein n=1 Tax=Fusarium circinatum TaxID=48490 RepID=A0A8H5TZ27_FUSCI|nr:hypothetical protein FCIRC_6535 [Fusarium circinatum]
MAIQDLMTGKVKHKRASAPKSRNGCITWTRHLKCDEAKPICNRCSEDKVKCDGYVMPKPKAPRRKHRKKVAPSIVDTLSLCLAVDDIPSLSTSERLYFQHFLQFTTTQLSLSPGPTNFWLRYALPIGYQFESIRYSMIVVGASHRLFMAKSLGHSDMCELKAFATHQYNKAIATIIPSMTASQDLQIIMICCLLFISFEGLTGRYDELLQHLSAGISLFNLPLSSSNDEDRGMTAKLAEMFCRLGVESSNFMQNDPRVSGMRKWYQTNKAQQSPSPKPFNNLDEASSALRHLDVLYDEKPWHYQGSDDPDKARLKEEATKKLQDALGQWTSRLDAFYKGRKEDKVIEGEQQYRNLRLRQHYWQMAIDSHSAKEAAADPKTFESFLTAAREASAPFIALNQPTFSLDGDLISGLAFVASTTTDDETKVQALDLLWRLNRREGLLDSRDFVELHELARALETCKELKFDANWKPTAAAGLPTIIERLRKSLR